MKPKKDLCLEIAVKVKKSRSLIKSLTWRVIALIITSILSTGIYSGSAPLKPSITAKSVACPFPVNDREPYKSTLTLFIESIKFSLRNSPKKRSAPRQGPNV